MRRPTREEIAKESHGVGQIDTWVAVHVQKYDISWVADRSVTAGQSCRSTTKQMTQDAETVGQLHPAVLIAVTGLLTVSW